MAESALVYGGFSFCGVNIYNLGLSFAPELEDTNIFVPNGIQTHIETFDGHDGGYYYGMWREPKEFTLRCYFEEKNIDRGIMTQIYGLFKPGRSGRLIFDRRPWCYYNATVTDVDVSELTNYLNGLVTIHMKAMYPFARSDIKVNTRAEMNHDIIMQNSAVFDKPEMDMATEYTNLTEQTEIKLCNQGTERAALGIAIAGDVGAGVTIANKTTGQVCKIVALSKAVTTDVNKVLLIDPINGKTVLTGPTGTSMAFMFHEKGFLSLESSYPAIRDIYADYSLGTSIHIANIFTEDAIGKYIFIDNKWRKIVSQPDRHTITVSAADTIRKTWQERTTIISLNEIVITPVSTMDITSLKFIYKPTYA